MSWETQAWAWRRHVGSPSGKLVLMALASYADQCGECFPSVALLAERTEQSADTVRRRLNELEAEGIIERVEQYSGNGTRINNLFRLLMDGEAGTDAAAERGGTPAICKGTPADCEGDPSTPARVTPATVRGYVKPPMKPPLKPTPHSPPAGGGVDQHQGSGEDEGTGTQLDALISEFKAADPLLIIDRPAARRLWSRMSSDERARALAGVSRYLDRWREAGKKFKLRAPSSYLKGRIWTDFAAVSPVTLPPRDLSEQARAVRWAAKGEPDDRWVFVAEGSAEWREWRSAFAAEATALGAGRHLLLPQTDGTLRRSEVPGRRFPMLRPPPRGAPAGDQQAAE